MLVTAASVLPSGAVVGQDWRALPQRAGAAGDVSLGWASGLELGEFDYLFR
jgi:hypothetical protein